MFYDFYTSKDCYMPAKAANVVRTIILCRTRTAVYTLSSWFTKMFRHGLQSRRYFTLLKNPICFIYYEINQYFKLFKCSHSQFSVYPFLTSFSANHGMRPPWLYSQVFDWSNPHKFVRIPEVLVLRGDQMYSKVVKIGKSWYVIWTRKPVLQNGMLRLRSYCAY